MAGRRFKLASLLLIIALLFGSTTAQAQSTGVNVIVHLTPLATINQVLRTLIGGTVLDSIPGADIYLVNVPNLPLVQSLLGTSSLLLQTLGIDWIEINKGVVEPSHVRFGVLQKSGAADWYKNQPSFMLTRAGQALPYADRAVRANPHSADAYTMLGYAQFASDHTRDAIVSWQRSLALRPAARRARHASDAASRRPRAGIDPLGDPQRSLGDGRHPLPA